MTKVAITGANGFLGKALAFHFVERGFDVICLHRHPVLPDLPGRQITYNLNMETFPLEEKVDAVVHCAWGMQKGMYRTNIRACHALLRYADREGSQLVFLGSISASENTNSEYARSKYMASRLLHDEGHLVLHPGLVIGNDGMFARLSNIVSRLPVIPIPGKGRQAMQLISVNGLADAVTRGISEGIRGSYYIAYNDPISLRDMIMQISTLYAKRTLLLPVPTHLYKIAVQVLYHLKLTSFNDDNVESLLNNQVHDTREDLSIFRIADRPPESALKPDMR